MHYFLNTYYWKGEIYLKRGNKLYTEGENTYFEALRNNGKKVIRNIVEVETCTTTNEGERSDIISAKKYINSLLSTLLFEKLEKQGLSTYYFSQGTTSTSKFVKEVEMIPLEVMGYNVSSRSLLERYGFKVGEKFDQLYCELIFNDNKGHNHTISDDIAQAIGLLNMIELTTIYDYMEIINFITSRFFNKLEFTLLDFKASFGFDCKTGKLLLASELNMDTCHLMDENGKTPYEQIFENGSSNNIYYERMVRMLKEM